MQQLILVSLLTLLSTGTAPPYTVQTITFPAKLSIFVFLTGNALLYHCAFVQFFPAFTLIVPRFSTPPFPLYNRGPTLIKNCLSRMSISHSHLPIFFITQFKPCLHLLRPHLVRYLYILAVSHQVQVFAHSSIYCGLFHKAPMA
jgi:hypothetical protein